jgi:hypothetical protein
MAKTIKRWPEVSRVRILHIYPGSPRENVYSEKRFISRFGDALLKREEIAPGSENGVRSDRRGYVA